MILGCTPVHNDSFHLIVFPASWLVGEALNHLLLADTLEPAAEICQFKQWSADCKYYIEKVWRKVNEFFQKFRSVVTNDDESLCHQMSKSQPFSGDPARILSPPSPPQARPTVCASLHARPGAPLTVSTTPGQRLPSTVQVLNGTDQF